MMSTKYDIFLKVLELGSLTRAAEHLGYTQSAISQAVRGLENELGITLLVRSRTSLSLTSEGQQLLPYIKEICQMQEQLSERVDAIKGICTGEVRIGAYHLIACHILPKMIRSFLELYPDIIFQIKEGDYTEIRDWITNGTVDFGFMAIQDTKDMECIAYTEDPLYAVFPSDAPECCEPFFDLQKLHSYPFIYLDVGKLNDCAAIFKHNHITPNTVYTVREDDTALSMVENHFGISILPAMAGLKHSYDVTFVQTLPSYNRILGIAIKDRENASRAVKEFIKFMKQCRSNL